MLCSWHCFRGFTCIHHLILRSGYFSHFADEESYTQKNGMNCPKLKFTSRSDWLWATSTSVVTCKISLLCLTVSWKSLKGKVSKRSVDIPFGGSSCLLTTGPSALSAQTHLFFPTLRNNYIPIWQLRKSRCSDVQGHLVSDGAGNGFQAFLVAKPMFLFRLLYYIKIWGWNFVLF